MGGEHLSWIEWLGAQSLVALGKGLVLCAEIAAVVLPLMILYEVIEARGILKGSWKGAERWLKPLGLGPRAIIPLMAGVWLGLLYGAGIVVATSEREGLDKRQRLSIALMLAMCHAIVEDTAIFAVLGASVIGILLPRVALAVMVGVMLGWWWARTAPGRGS